MITIQYISQIPAGIRLSPQYWCETLEEAEQLAVSMTSGDVQDTDGTPLDYEVAIIRRNVCVMARYFHTMQIP